MRIAGIFFPIGFMCLLTLLGCSGASDRCKVDSDCYPGVGGFVCTDDGYCVQAVYDCQLDQDCPMGFECKSSKCVNELELEREIRNVDVLFVVDNSGSMADDQMACACAMNSFLEATQGADIDTGVIGTNFNNSRPNLAGIRDQNSCSIPVNNCECGPNGQLPPQPDGFQACEFNNQGRWINIQEDNATELLRKTIVQGEDGGGKEAGLQQAFRLFAQMEIAGTLQGTYETVVITDEEADADGSLCPFDGNLDQALQNGLKDTSLGFNPPAMIGTQASCLDDLEAFYSYYFKSRNIMVHGLIYTTDCPSESEEEFGSVYEKVVKATGGNIAPICDCNAFDPFFLEIGAIASHESTQLCLDSFFHIEQVEDASNRVVIHYIEGGADALVPQSTSDGWMYDEQTDCFILAGSWKYKMGSFRVEIISG